MGYRHDDEARAIFWLVEQVLRALAWLHGRPPRTVPVEVDVPAAPVRELGERLETVAEARARTGPGWGHRPLALLVPGFLLLLAAPAAAWKWALLAPGLALVAYSLRVSWRLPDLRRLGPVRCVEGRLGWVTVRAPGRREQRILYVGDRYPAALPAHWRTRLVIPQPEATEIHLRRDGDGAVLRVGRFSIDEEVRRAPPVYWAHHLTLAVACALLALLASHLARPPTSGRGGAAAAPRRVYDPEPLLAHPPEVGTQLELHAQVRCQILPRDEDGLGPVSCDTVRWGGALTVPPAPTDPVLQALEDPDAVTAEEVEGGNGSDRATRDVRLAHVSRLARLIDRACGESVLPPCSYLLVDRASIRIESHQQDWFVIPAGREAGPDDAAFVSAAAFDALRTRMRDLRRAREAVTYGRLARDAVESQRGGILLRVGPSAPDPSAWASGPADPAAGATPDPMPPAAARHSAADRWAQYRALAGPPQPWELRGRVADVSRDAQGDLVLTVDTAPPVDEAASASQLRRWASAFAVALAAVHATACAVNAVRARRRARALAAEG